MNLLDKITLAVINAPMVIKAPVTAGSDDKINDLVNTITGALTGVISGLYAIGILILGYRLIKDIVLSKKEDNPEEEVAKYKKRISNTIIAMVIITVVEVGLTVGFFTFIKDWITNILQK